jgi:hypothetical protein
MSTDGPQPTQGAPKKKKEGKSVGCFLGLFFLPCFFWVFFFWRPLHFSVAILSQEVRFALWLHGAPLRAAALSRAEGRWS